MAITTIYNKGLNTLVLFDNKKKEKVILASGSTITTEDKDLIEMAKKHGVVECWEGVRPSCPSHDKELKELKKENASLKKEVEDLKKEVESFKGAKE